MPPRVGSPGALTALCLCIAGNPLSAARVLGFSGGLAGDFVWNELHDKRRAVGDSNEVAVGGEECSVPTYGACGDEGVRGGGRDAAPAAGVPDLGCEKVVFTFR